MEKKYVLSEDNLVNLIAFGIVESYKHPNKQTKTIAKELLKRFGKENLKTKKSSNSSSKKDCTHNSTTGINGLSKKCNICGEILGLND